jgi:MFS family permease
MNESPVRAAEPTTPTRWAVGSLALSALLASLGTSIANVALPTLADAFTAPFPRVQWVVLAYLLAMTVLIVSAGRLGDVLGRRRVLLAGIAVFTIGSVLGGVAPTLGVLIAARAVQGVGAAVLMALTMALVRDVAGPSRTGSAMGLLGTMSAVGTALGPSLGGVLLAGPGWRAIFLGMLPLGVLAFFLASRHLSADGPRGPRGQGFDRWGTLLLGLTLAVYALAVTVGSGRPVLLCAAGLGTVLFLLVERRAPAPLIRLAMFRDVVVSAGLTMNAVVATVMMTTLVVGPFYLSLALGLGDAVVGAAMSLGPVVSVLTGVPAGRIVDRLGTRFAVIAGLGVLAVGCAGLAVLPTWWGLAGYLVAIAVVTPGYQLFQAANNTAVMIDVAPDRRGALAGLLGLSRNLGLITGASVMGALFAAASATTDLTTASRSTVAGGARTTFALMAALVVVAAVVAIAGRRAVPGDQSRQPVS